MRLRLMFYFLAYLYLWLHHWRRIYDTEIHYNLLDKKGAWSNILHASESPDTMKSTEWSLSSDLQSAGLLISSLWQETVQRVQRQKSYGLSACYRLSLSIWQDELRTFPCLSFYICPWSSGTPTSLPLTLWDPWIKRFHQRAQLCY